VQALFLQGLQFLVLPIKGLPTIGDEFGYNPVVLLPAGLRAVLSEVAHFASDADECPA